MDILIPFVFAGSILLSSSSAGPLASGIRFSDDGGFIMPGVGLRKVYNENPVAIVRPAFTPLFFGNEEPRDRPISFSFLDRKKVTSDVKVPVATNIGNDIPSDPKKTVSNPFRFPGVPVMPNAASVTNAPPNVTASSTNASVLNATLANITKSSTTTTANVALASIEIEAKNSTDVKPVPATSSKEADGSAGVLYRGTINVNLNNTAKPPLQNSTAQAKPKCDLSSGVVEFNGTCARFLARNGCPQGQWLVKNDVNGSGCSPRPCPAGQLLHEGKCINITDESVCNDGQMLYVDFTGNVHCDCQPNFIYDPWSGNCFALGDQGYCNFGEHLTLGVNGSVNCERNPCIMNGYVFHNDSGRCYRKMFRGFCDEGFLIVHAMNRTAECSAIATHSIFDLPTMRSCDGGTVRDYAGTCREEFRVPTLSSFPAMYGDCPFGFVKDAQGTCRKPHNLFG